MKKRVNVMLSEEAISKADKSGNRSQYIEDLILGGTPPSVEEKGLTEGRVLYLISQELEKMAKLPSLKPVVKEEWQGDGMAKACCLGNCKHWVWNMDEGATINSITGERRE